MERVMILRDGRACGELTVQEQGLYLCCRAVCDARAFSAPMRLVAVGEQGELGLGIPQPEGGRFVLDRQLSLREARCAGRLLRGELRPAGGEKSGWEPAARPEELAREEHLRKLLRDAESGLTCRRGEDRLLALPFDPAKPFPLTELFCLARICAIGQREYAVFRFDREGRPVPP